MGLPEWDRVRADKATEIARAVFAEWARDGSSVAESRFGTRLLAIAGGIGDTGDVLDAWEAAARRCDPIVYAAITFEWRHRGGEPSSAAYYEALARGCGPSLGDVGGAIHHCWDGAFARS
jgi:hypothetical protein